MRRSILTLFAVAALLVSLTPSSAVAADAHQYSVTVTNLTPGQVLAPPLVVTHDIKFSLFHLGQPASAGVAAMAEDAQLGMLMADLEVDPRVHDFSVWSGGPVPPGQSATVEVESQFPYIYVSVAQMLVTTNDAFFAIRERVPRGPSVDPRNNQRTFFAYAYDAGSEANNEDCATIPGPPCGNGGVRATDGAEGFVHVHSGIHGIGDLAPETFDWDNPVAQITVTRIR